VPKITKADAALVYRFFQGAPAAAEAAGADTPVKNDSAAADGLGNRNPD
jgi:hypothetical protein